MKTKYSYSDIVLEPSYSEIRSRDEINTYVNFCNHDFRCAAFPSNMICTINFEMARAMSEDGYFYIMHRFEDYQKTYEWLEQSQSLRTISISVGVKQRDKDFIEKIAKRELKVHFITIDVASGHNILVKEMIRFIRKHLGRRVQIIAGNIGTSEAAVDLAKWGADAVKVGLSMGKSCTTYNCTGVGTPMFSTVRDIANECPIPVIADGQVREVGDICKALVAGATMVMVGSEFARCVDSPSKTVKRLEDPTAGIYTHHKEFFGSASKYTKGSDSNHIEGTLVTLPMRDKTYTQYMDEINDGISSCCSYAGVETIPRLIAMKYSLRN